MADLPIDLPANVAGRLARALDVEGKIPRALEALGPVGGREVLLVDVPEGLMSHRLQELGARLRHVAAASPLALPVPDASVDVVIGLWSAFRGVDPADLVETDRVLRPNGRLLVVHDYGRDDVCRLRDADLPEYGSWSRRGGPFLSGGFRIRVVHCFWTFEDLEDQRSFLVEAFGEQGAALAETARRPRLSWNVAIYHRTRGGVVAEDGDGLVAVGTGAAAGDGHGARRRPEPGRSGDGPR
ncbi:MAG TPA: methyltransferase domain-containing protein [Candidatus Limnocylindrales bacterium]|nr:methyltransferase domain-containing protein [Candidatus Limnocylindrales bacterium]